MPAEASAVTTPTRRIDLDGRSLAYRDLGTGTPIMLLVRYRGTMDSWDPAFLDRLVSLQFRVITFDYSGLGASTGTPTYNPASMAQDALDLLDGLGIGSAVLAGWSLGGVAAQIALAKAPSRVRQLLLIGTTPPGPLVKTADPRFYELAKRENDLEDVIELFFDPSSEASRAAARASEQRLAARTTDLSRPVPVEWAGTQISGPRNPAFPADAILDMLKTTETPLLHVGGTRDIVFPVENWHALAGTLPTLRLLTMPASGHAPHHQYPDEVAGAVAAFIHHSRA